jgi:hypothetical protein
MGEFLIIGFVVGILLGFVIKRGDFCMYKGFTNMVISKDYRIIKATIWAFLVTMIAFHVLASMGIVTLDPKPFFWIGSIVGALLFSIGMVLSGSCIVGTPMRAASGRMGYWLTLIGMGLGGWLVIWGPWSSFRVESLQEASKVMVGDKVPTLSNLFGVNPWIVVVILAAISIWLLIKLKGPSSDQEETSLTDKIFKNLWAPAAIGISLAVIEVIALTSGESPAGLGGFIKGWAMYFRGIFTGELPFGWPATEVLGILVGVFIASLIAKDFRIVWPKLKQTPRLFFGGCLMGIGAVTAAGGCNVAHIITHMPQLSIGSFVSGTVIILTVTVLVRFFIAKDIK